MESETTLSRDELRRMITAIEPSWEIDDVTPAERGHSEVYHVAVRTTDGPREYVLKAASGDADRRIATEARLLALLGDRTTIPVPPVVGAVDEREDLPAPFFLMESMPGTELGFEETTTVPDRCLRRLARRTGEYLGELHALDAVDSFGAVRCERNTQLHGECPAPDFGRIRVVDGSDSWPEYLSSTIDRELERHGSTRFADLAPALREWFRERVDGVPASFSPVVGRIDHGVHNLLVDPDVGEIRAVLDWEFAPAVTPGYDLQCVEYVLSGAVLSPIPGAPDRRELVRDAMEEGYVAVDGGSPEAVAEYREYHQLYELLAVVRSMNHLDSGVATVPAEHETDVAAGLRAEAERLLGTDS